MGKDRTLRGPTKRAQSEIEDFEKTKGGKVRKEWEIKKKFSGAKRPTLKPQ